MLDRLFRRGSPEGAGQQEDDRFRIETQYQLRDPDGYWGWYPESIALVNKDWPLAGKRQVIRTGERENGRIARVILDSRYYSPEDTGEVARLESQGTQVTFSQDPWNETFPQGAPVRQ